MSDDLTNLTIIHYPDPRLRQRSDPVTVFDAELAALAERMIAMMRAARGVGLAAPQVGVNKRFFVMCLPEGAKEAQVFVNPEMRELQGGAMGEEGCLSLPDVRVQVRRALRGCIVAQDVHGRPFQLEGRDLRCRVWQHETDHLNGMLIIDRMGEGDRISTKAKLRELEDMYRQAAAKTA